MRADLIVVADNPLEDLGALQAPKWLFRRHPVAKVIGPNAVVSHSLFEALEQGPQPSFSIPWDLGSVTCHSTRTRAK